MTKREIISWLKSKKEDTLYKLSLETKKAKETAFNNKYKELGLEEFEKEADLKFNEFFEEYKKKFGENVYFDYSGFKNKLQYLINDMHELVKSDVKRSLNGFLDINKKETLLKNEIGKNYDNLICNVKNISKVKEIVEYLKSLDIELPIEKNKDGEQITSVAIPINTEYLFLNINKGDNNAENS
mgnify:CR=1 FL=1